MKKFWVWIGIAVVVILAVVLIVTQTRKEEKEIKIGVILPLTGDGASLGEDCKNGIEIAKDEFNEKGMKIVLFYEDSQGKPDKAINAFYKLVGTGVKIIIGDLFSSPTLAIAPLAEKNKVFIFSPGASNPKLSGISRYVFRNYPSDNLEGELIAKYIKKKGFSKVALLYPNNEYGVGLKNVFTETFLKLGGNVVLSEGYNEDETDFRSILTKVIHSSSDALYLPGYYYSIGRIAVQFKQMGGRLPIFSNIGVEDPKLLDIAKDAVEGLVYTAPDVNLKSQAPQIQRFVKIYMSKYSKEPGFPAAYGYDTAIILFSVIRNYGSDPESIRKGLLENRFEGITGSVTFKPTGDVIKPFVVKMIKNKKFETIERIEE
jgi:branched-chain amino acid transport system substrate-binding protein